MLSDIFPPSPITRVCILYSPRVPCTYGIDLNIDLRGIQWTSEIENRVRDGLATRFYEKAVNANRGAEHRHFFRNDGITTQQDRHMTKEENDVEVPQDQLDDAAQEIFDEIIEYVPPYVLK
jgi:hypothetical protein